nr:hypothetical protein [Tanacetum cinerariifolium]
MGGAAHNGGKKVDDECSNSLKEGGEKKNVRDGFVWDLNGEQFSPISNKTGNMNVGNEELKECLDKEDNCSGDANINKDNCKETVIIGDDNVNSSNEDVNVVNDKSEEGISKEKIDMQSTRKNRNNVVKLVDIVNSSKLDNKLLSVPTQISETGNGMVIFDDEIIELGSRIGFARVLVEIDVEKGIKDKIEIIYKSKNVVEDSYCKVQRKNVDNTGNVKINENEFKVMQNRKYEREGSNMNNVNKKTSGSNMERKYNKMDNGKVSHEGSTSVGNSNGKGVLEGWSGEMKRYYRDKELFDVIQEMEKNDDVLVENFGIENVVLRNEVEGLVRSVWDKRFEGHTMYRVVQKLKNLKRKLKQLSWKNGNVVLRAEKLREKVRESHKEVDMFPHDENVKENSCRILKEYYKAMKEENSLLCQKSKVEWLREGDRNTTCFHKTIKERVHRGRIMTIRNEEGVRFENKDVAYQIVKHFKEFLGKSSIVQDLTYMSEIFINKLNPEEAERMVRPISESEIKNAMFEIKDSKASSPDCYTSRFYKSA